MTRGVRLAALAPRTDDGPLPERVEHVILCPVHPLEHIVVDGILAQRRQAEITVPKLGIESTAQHQLAGLETIVLEEEGVRRERTIQKNLPRGELTATSLRHAPKNQRPTPGDLIEGRVSMASHLSFIAFGVDHHDCAGQAQIITTRIEAGMPPARTIELGVAVAKPRRPTLIPWDRRQAGTASVGKPHQNVAMIGAAHVRHHLGLPSREASNIPLKLLVWAGVLVCEKSVDRVDLHRLLLLRVYPVAGAQIRYATTAVIFLVV